ncbi:hypothetical protein [Pseudomonas moraviensis]
MKESQLFQPDAAHLKRLQDFEIQQYRDNIQCNIEGRSRLGIVECFEVKGLQAGLDKYAELLSQGYSATDSVSHVPQLAMDFLILHLKKPAALVEQDEAHIKAACETAYLAQLADAKAACVAKEVESLLAGEKRRKQQAEFDAKAAQEAEEYARVEAEVLAALGGKP